MTRKYGYLQSPTDLRDYRISGVSNIDLPEEYDIGVMNVLDQGNVNSCVPHALVNIISHIKKDSYYSVGWLYGYRPNNYYQGERNVPKRSIENTI